MHEFKCQNVHNSRYSLWTHLIFVSHLSPHAVHSLLKSAFNSIAIEKEKLKQMVSEQDHNKGHSTQMARLRQSLSQVNDIMCFLLISHFHRMGVEAVRHGGVKIVCNSPKTLSVSIKFCYFSSIKGQGEGQNQPNLLANIYVFCLIEYF